MTTNVNPDTGIAYGYISANSLDSDLVNELQDNGTDVYYADALEEAQKEVARTKDAQDEAQENLEYVNGFPDEVAAFTETLQYVKDNWSGSSWEQQFNDRYQPDEPIHEGEKDGVKYRTSWLGGALGVWIFESPFTGRFQECSPCVPHAANLDYPEDRPNAAATVGYDVPPSWRRTET
jgi:hypothetical protein